MPHYFQHLFHKVVAGPRGRVWVLTHHVIDRWLERFDGGLADLRHAVQFSRVVATCGDALAALWYEPDGAAFVCRRAGGSPNTWLVVTALPPWLGQSSLRRAVAAYRVRAGLVTAGRVAA